MTARQMIAKAGWWLVAGGGCLCLLAGCVAGGSSAPDGQPLLHWLSHHGYSSWENRITPIALPRRYDGFTLGNRQVFAAVGVSVTRPTRIDLLWGDHKAVRPVAKPLAIDFVVSSDGDPLTVTEYRQRRMRHTSIITGDLRASKQAQITVVDFAPEGPELNALVRIVAVTNRAKRPLHNARVDMAFQGQWVAERAQRHSVTFSSYTLALYSPQPLQHEEGTQSWGVHLGSLPPGGTRVAAFYLVPAHDRKALDQGLRDLQPAAADPLALLRATYTASLAWYQEAPLPPIADPRLADLMDGILCQMRVHEGTSALHTGSLRYRHDRAYVRDNYWVQRAWLEVGRPAQAKKNLDFFLRAWRTSGIVSYYDIPTRRGHGYGYQRVELPHYLVLMVRDAERLGGVDPKPYYRMVKTCLAYAAVPDSGLQPMNGDETWLLACSVNELDDFLDNSWLLVASARYGADLARRVGETADAARWQQMADRAEAALTKFVSSRTGRLAFSRSADGTLDDTLASEAFARGLLLDACPESLRAPLDRSLVASWRYLQHREGIRTHARSPIVCGGTPGYFLAAVASSHPGIAADLAGRLPRFCASTGDVWEFQSIYDPEWGGEKRRLWDSAVVLMGLVRYARGASAAPTAAPTPTPPTGWPVGARDFLGRAQPDVTIRHVNAPEHAAEIVDQMLRQLWWWTPIMPGRQAKRLGHEIVIDRRPPGPGVYRGQGYGLESDRRARVEDTGRVYRDTAGIIADLINGSLPRQPKPAPFPNANEALAQRFGRVSTETLRGRLVVTDMAGRVTRTESFRLPLARDTEWRPLGLSPVKVKATLEGPMLSLRVAAGGMPPSTVQVEIVFSQGWWVVNSRDFQWDRVVDPVEQRWHADGTWSLAYRLHPTSTVEKAVTLRLTKLIAPH